VTEAEPGEDPASSGRGAVYVSQAYYYVVAAVGLLFLLGGAIAALIALRKWILPISEASDPSGFLRTSVDTNDAARSFLGALAFAIPGAVLFAWHLREARRREGRPGSRASWGGALYFHLVALVSVSIALGGVVAALHALRDWVVPFCYETTSGYSEGPQLDDPTFGGEVSPYPPIELPADFDPELLRSEECSPSAPEALRSTLDGGIVAAVAGGAWVWHLRRGRRALDGPPPGS
jgi:hypothetical protein